MEKLSTLVSYLDSLVLFHLIWKNYILDSTLGFDFLFASKVWGESKDYFEGVSVRFSLVLTSILLKTHRLYVFLRFSRFLYVLKSCSEQFCCMVLHSFAPWFGVSPNFMWSYFARVLNSLHVWTPTFLVTFEAIFCLNNIWNFLGLYITYIQSCPTILYLSYRPNSGS